MLDLAKLALVAALVACSSNSSPGGHDAPETTGDGNGSGSGMIDAAAPDGGTAGVACGMMTCGTGMDCCVTFANQMASYACITSGGQCQGLSQACDGPEDCTNSDRCCASFGGGGGGGITCQPASGTCGRELCHTPADCSTAGAMCCPSQFLSYSFCAATCP